MSKEDKHETEQVNQCPPGTTTHIIEAGDTLWQLARTYGTTVDEIIAANPGIDPANLQVGQRVCIPVEPDICPPGSVPYIIQAGDTFWRIAQNLGVSVQDIINLNPGVDPNRLMVGQQICVPAPPDFVQPCCVPLLPVNADERSRIGGSVWIREDEFTVTGYPIMFAATFLPDPEDLGNYNTYIGRISIAQPSPEPPIVFSVRLVRTIRPTQQATWAGTRIIPDGPSLTDVVEIRPFNSNQDITGPAILRNTLEHCARG